MFVLVFPEPSAAPFSPTRGPRDPQPSRPRSGLTGSESPRSRRGFGPRRCLQLGLRPQKPRKRCTFRNAVESLSPTLRCSHTGRCGDG